MLTTDSNPDSQKKQPIEFYNSNIMSLFADDFVTVRGDNDVPWRDEAPVFDDAWWRSVGWW